MLKSSYVCEIDSPRDRVRTRAERRGVPSPCIEPMDPMDSLLDLLLVDRRDTVFGSALATLSLARDETESPRDLERTDLRGVVVEMDVCFLALAGGLGGRLLLLLAAPRLFLAALACSTAAPDSSSFPGSAEATSFS